MQLKTNISDRCVQVSYSLNSISPLLFSNSCPKILVQPLSVFFHLHPGDLQSLPKKGILTGGQAVTRQGGCYSEYLGG